ncbi:hypothetical protein [Enterococcus sp. CWB-B31]|uniref:hypothetical protein n=1 Tax=Enterococcus sp. CWB-B31 TaxID=2885159 RepID=UPI001E567A9E|nr:hypothetical protein [Enterococcus sp. CWB-B31]MCB5953469.1 hypothetical protein [Enterococcus sp. CWB-B31]
MNMLFIFEDGMATTFYLYLLKDGKKKLLRFSPEVQYQSGETLSQKYRLLSTTAFIDFFETAVQLKIENFVIADKERVLDFLFKNKQELVINNPATFTYTASDRYFEKGKQHVTKAALTDFISYQLDAPNQLGIFERQEHVLRLIKNELVGDKRITAIPKKFNELNKSVTTNMKLPTLLKFFKAYRETDKGKTQRLTVPDVLSGSDKLNWPQKKIETFIN